MVAATATLAPKRRSPRQRSTGHVAIPAWCSRRQEVPSSLASTRCGPGSSHIVQRSEPRSRPKGGQGLGPSVIMRCGSGLRPAVHLLPAGFA